jgi:hypothetical protein
MFGMQVQHKACALTTPRALHNTTCSTSEAGQQLLLHRLFSKQPVAKAGTAFIGADVLGPVNITLRHPDVPLLPVQKHITGLIVISPHADTAQHTPPPSQCLLCAIACCI